MLDDNRQKALVDGYLEVLGGKYNNSREKAAASDRYISDHPELKQLAIIDWIWEKAQYYAKLGILNPQVYNDAQNYALVVYLLCGEIKNNELGAKACDLIADTSEKTGDMTSARNYRLAAKALRGTL